MRRVKWAFVLLALTTTDIWAQQSAPPAQQIQDETKTGPVVQYKPGSPPPKGAIRTCPAKFKFHPKIDGVYKVGGDVKPPKATNKVETELTDEARQEIRRNPNFNPTSVLNMIVDTNGQPQDLCIQRFAGYGLDVQAINVATQFRFLPATKNGVPVAVRIDVEVNFHTYY